MRRIVLLLLSLTVVARGEEGVAVAVDPAVELMSTIFRLAGSPEYNKFASHSAYSRRVTEHYGKHRDHAVIAKAKALRQARGVSFDAVMSMAVHLKYEDGRFVPRVPFDPRPPLLERRWTIEDAAAFLELANDFAKRADFAGFWKANEAFYATAAARMKAKIAAHDVLGWYELWFGTKAGGQARVALGLLNGPGNYGVSFRADAQAPMEATPVIGVYQFDGDGNAVIGDDVIPMLVHEIGHAFVNPYVDRHVDSFLPAAQRIYPHREDRMKRQAYATPIIMVYESIVRACTVRYIAQKQGAARAASLAKNDAQRGFSWIANLAALLERYESGRETFKTLDDFTPQLAEFFAHQAKLIAAAPLVVSISPANGATDVDPATNTLEIRFDQPMLDGSWSVIKSNEAFPAVTGKVSYDRKREVLTIPIRLRPGTRYRFFLNSATATGFRSKGGVPLAPVEVTFTTRK